MIEDKKRKLSKNIYLVWDKNSNLKLYSTHVLNINDLLFVYDVYQLNLNFDFWNNKFNPFFNL